MKRIVGTLIFGLVTIIALAQESAPNTLNGWAERVQKFGKSVPQEQIFIHTDNTCYFLGDTIYFKAYVRRSDTGAPSKLSGLLYTELLNQDGFLVERKQIELKDGEGEGSFCLLDSLYGGYYELRAYTRWQLNWGAYTHEHTKFAEKWFYNRQMALQYYRDYEKLYSRVFPVYDKPQQEGEYLHEMTLRPLLRHFKADNAVPEATVKFYPEGGHLIANAPCSVAFEANDEEGRHLEGSLSITDASGKKVAETKVENRGRGSFTFTPKTDGKYKAQFTWPKGESKADLPEVESDGCAIQVTSEGEKLSIRLHPRGKAAGTPLGMTVMHQGVMLDFQELGQGEDLSLTLEKKDLHNGVIQLSVFDAQGCIYADRLVFVRNGQLEMNPLSFQGIESTYEPYAPIHLSVEGGQAGSHVSVAVRDAAHAEYIYDNGTMLTEMLLSSQIRGFVEDPNYYFESEDEPHLRALDLLLMVQGWRRYNWHTMATPGAFVLNFMPEKTQMMSGEVNNYQSVDQEHTLAEDAMAAATGEEKTEVDLTRFERGTQPTAGEVYERFNQKETNLKREMLMHAEFTKPGAPEGVVGEMMTKGGYFSIESPRFYENCYFFLGASDSTKWKDEEKAELKRNWVVKGEDADHDFDIVYPEFYVKLNPIYPRFVKPYNWYQQHLAPAPQGSALSPDWLNDGSYTMEEVTVGARHNGRSRFNPNKPAYVIDAYQAFNDVCDAGLCTGVFTGADRFVQDVARVYIGDMNMERTYEVQKRMDTHNDSFYMSDSQKMKYNHLSHLGKVYIYTDYSPRREGDKHFEASNQPTVDIDLRLIEGDGLRDVMRDRRYILSGYSVCEDFYQPDYSQKPLPEHKDYRRTLYWNPSIELDNQGKAQLNFYNNGKQTQVTISAEGMTPDGTPLSGLSMPETRK